MHRLSYFAAVLLAAGLCFVSLSAAQAAILITINKAAQQMTVEVDGETRWTWPVSTGRRGYDTPAGDFRPFRMEEDHYSKEWDEAPMPYSIFFTDSGHAIHGSFQTRALGRAASHGCVRLSPKNAAKLFALVKRKGLSNAKVVVIADPNAPVVAKHRAPAQKVQEARKVIPTPASRAETSTYAVAPDQTLGYLPIAAPPVTHQLQIEQPAIALPAASAVQHAPPYAPNLN
jgi:hypothetical protein